MLTLPVGATTIAVVDTTGGGAATTGGNATTSGLALPPPAQSPTTNDWLPIAIGVPVAVIAALAIALLVFFVARRRRSAQQQQHTGSAAATNDVPLQPQGRVSMYGSMAGVAPPIVGTSSSQSMYDSIPSSNTEPRARYESPESPLS